MNKLISPIALCLLFVSTVGCTCVRETTYFTATAAEEPEWIVLFDGTSLEHFRPIEKDAFPNNSRWRIDDGTLHYTGGKFGGDIVTKQTFGDFELQFEWKISEGGNSGVKYRVGPNKDPKNIRALGLEYQILDDDKHGNGRNPKTSAGSLYSLIAPNENKSLKPVGQWNQSSIVLQNNRVQHWLNGEVILAYEIGSEELNKLIAKSKYKNDKTFGKHDPGHIAIQDHDDKAWYRKIRIRELDKKSVEPQ